MTTNLVDTLNPEYIKKFTCIGAACEDTCCSGWRVNVDEETYRKYKKVKNFDMKLRLEKDITRNRSNPTKNNVAKMRMEKGKCSFLSKEGWCDIQTKLGEDYLCNTCAVYPRRINKVNNIIEQSLTVSCPEAARLVLLNEIGINFVLGQEVVSIREYSSIINTSKGKITHWKECIDEYRYLTILILQNRDYTLEERLLILGLLYNELELCVKNNRLNEIPDILGQYLKSVEDYTFKGAFNNVSNQLDIQLQLCRELVILRLKEGITSSRYLECSRDMMLGLKIEVNTTNEEVKEAYEYSYAEYYAPFMQEHEYMLENFLVNYVFKNCMPIDCDAPFESYTRMILHYSLIKLHLVGIANHYNGLTSDLVIKLVQSLSKTFEHNPTYFEKTMGLFKENNLMNLTYMSMLVKN
ncbi:flagellin lysine-N-methylase [Neobacillus citreus]|uniref:Flagellin lysine-N-methylase n=1 Tax=Neobacillus citreus TaxID=2833578 RepID=A0A942Y7X6_9BACI|nr:flagellin lysine-N-methylase [Neobacillus citreus]MCH6263910.1 flagellin lysine-N-methylase [Neobacillus citreus]